MLDSSQRGVLRGMLAGLALTVGGFAAAVAWPPAFVGLLAGPLDALRMAAPWDLLPLLCLAGNIAFIARHRFVTPQDIDGSAMTEGTARVRRYQAGLQNTLEQVALALPVHWLWALTQPLRWQAVVPVAAVLFAVGRLLFWHGQTRGAPARALGFALTFYPSMLLLCGAGVAALLRAA